MKKCRLAILVLLLTSLLFVGCNDQSVVEGNSNPKNEENEDLQARIEELEQQNLNLQATITELTHENEELDNLLTVQTDNLDQVFSSHEEQVDAILAFLNEEELNALAKDRWQYNLSANEVGVPENGVIEVEADQVEITLVQNQLDMSFLPYEILEQGQISGESYHEHILQVSREQDEETWRDGTTSTGYGLIYTGLTSSDEIEITITNELMNRLGLHTNQIIVQIK